MCPSNIIQCVRFVARGLKDTVMQNALASRDKALLTRHTEKKTHVIVCVDHAVPVARMSSWLRL